MKLQDFANLYFKEDHATIGASNIDDVFAGLKQAGLNEIEVNAEQMYLLVVWYLANARGDKNGNQGKIIREGKLDKFLGVNIIYGGDNSIKEDK